MKKIDNLCLRWHILRNYCFKLEVTFKYKWLPQVFSLQFSLIARTLSLGIDNNELFFAIQKSWKNSFLMKKTYVFLQDP